MGPAKDCPKELAFWLIAPSVLPGDPVVILVTPAMVTITEKARKQNRCLSPVRDHSAL